MLISLSKWLLSNFVSSDENFLFVLGMGTLVSILTAPGATGTVGRSSALGTAPVSISWEVYSACVPLLPLLPSAGRRVIALNLLADRYPAAAMASAWIPVETILSAAALMDFLTPSARKLCYLMFVQMTVMDEESVWTVEEGGRYASVKVISQDHHAVSRTVVKLPAAVMESVLQWKIPRCANVMQDMAAAIAGSPGLWFGLMLKRW